MIKAYGIGRLTADLELKYTQSNIPFTQFTIATDRPFKSDDGEKQADFIQAVSWRALSENMVKYCGKGSKIFVEGRWTTRTYEGSDGKTIYVNELLVESCEFLDTKKEDKKEHKSYEVDKEKKRLQDEADMKKYNIDSDSLPF